MVHQRLLILLFCALLSLTYSCKKQLTKNKPVIVLTEEQLIAVMTDAQILEAALNHKRNIGQSTTELKSVWYNQLFERYQITNQIFEDNLNYYAENPGKMESILEEVLARLSQMQSEVNAEKDSTQIVSE